MRPLKKIPTMIINFEIQLKIVDVEIDRLVYDLYGLMEEEIGIVEKE